MRWNICLFFSAVFIVQFLLLSLLFGIPLMILFASLGQYLGSGVIDMWRISPIFQVLIIILIDFIIENFFLMLFFCFKGNRNCSFIDTLHLRSVQHCHYILAIHILQRLFHFFGRTIRMGNMSGIN